MNVSTSLSLPIELLKRLEETAHEYHLNKSALAADLIREGLRRIEKDQ